VPLLEDLPAAADSAALAPSGSAPAARHGSRIIAVFSGASRKGAWRVPPTSQVVTVFGGANIDLRDAILPGREITIRAVSVFAGLSITVPPETRVIDSGVAIFGGRDVSGESTESEAPGSPVLRLQGTCAVAVKHKPRKLKRR
jgi:Cell wall-active antibiotics response 4TMS YvqF